MIDRRMVAKLALGWSAWAGAMRPAIADVSDVYGFVFPGIDGADVRLADHRGKVMLIVNTASHCSYTNQYAGLQKLWQRYGSRGLIVIGVPSNDFGGQEPGTETEIQGFCSSTFGVTFPLTAKTVVEGAEAHPFYQWAAAQNPAAVPRWNFHKLLLGRNGRLAHVFPTSVAPEDPRIAVALELALAAPAAS